MTETTASQPAGFEVQNLPDGTAKLFHNGTEIGTIAYEADRSQIRPATETVPAYSSLQFVVRGLTIEEVEPGERYGESVFFSSIAAGGAERRTEVRD